jgi:sulfur carrier protein
MTITVNGERRELADGASVLDLLTSLGLNLKTVVIQRNGAIIERTAFGSTVLFDGDDLDLVRFVGGG